MPDQAIQCLSLFSSFCIGTAFILLWLATVQCNYLKLVLQYENAVEMDSFDLHFGLWSYQMWTHMSSSGLVFEGCHSYPDFIELDSQWTAARAFSVMALVLGVGMMMTEVFSLCKKYKKAHDLRISILNGCGYLLCSLFTGLSLLLLGSDLCKDNELSEEITNSFPNINMSISGCALATGAKCALSAAILYFVAAAASLRAYMIGADDDKNIESREINAAASVGPLLMGYDEFNSVSTKWLHGRE